MWRWTPIAPPCRDGHIGRRFVIDKLQAPRDRLLCAASDLFHAKDIHLVGIDEIVKAAEVAAPGHPVTQAARQRKDVMRPVMERTARAAGLTAPGAMAESLMLPINGATGLAPLNGAGDHAEQAMRAARNLIASMPPVLH